MDPGNENGSRELAAQASRSEILDQMAVVTPKFKSRMEVLDGMPVVIPKVKTRAEILDQMARLTTNLTSSIT